MCHAKNHFFLFRVRSRDDKGEGWEEKGRKEGWGRTNTESRKDEEKDGDPGRTVSK